MKSVALVIVFLPVIAFGIAAVREILAKESWMLKALKLLPILFGLVAFGLFFGLWSLLRVTSDGSVVVCRIMTIICAAIASSGAFFSYSRRSSSRWVAIGGLVMMILWMFNYIVD